MVRDGAGVAAGDRPVSAAVAVAQRVVERGAEQRAEQPGGSATPAAPQEVDGLGDQRDQVVGAVGQGRVVERADVLGDADRLAAHLDDERLGDAPRGLVAAR